MGQSVLVFISHSSEDKEEYINHIVSDLEDCYIHAWIDKKRIVPGENLRKSVFRDGLDKANVALIFFTEQSIKSHWVDREIKHVLREESKKGNDFDIHKIISIYDSQATYTEISNRFPELTDNLFHLMPQDYNKVQLGQLISAIWSKYLSLQGGDVETQRQLLAKDKELFQRDKEILELKTALEKAQSNDKSDSQNAEFEAYLKSGKIDDFLKDKESLKNLILGIAVYEDRISPLNAKAFGFLDRKYFSSKDKYYYSLTDKGKAFFEWYTLNHSS